MIHRDEESGNILFDELIDKMAGRGMFPLFLQYFRSMDPKDRYKYKIIKKGVSPYDTTNEIAVIQIIPEKEGEEESK
jgi:hypothetical protein